MWDVRKRKKKRNQTDAEKSKIETDAEAGKTKIKLYETDGAAIEMEQYAVDILGGQCDYVGEDEEYEIVY